MSKMQPRDLVVITSGNNKITIKAGKKVRPKGVVKAATGIWKDRPELVDEMLLIREDESDRPGTTLN